METLRIIAGIFVVFGPVVVNALAPEKTKDDWTATAWVIWIISLLFIAFTME